MLWGTMNTAVMALNAMSSDMGVISQNISNMNTYGYKVGRAQFQTVMSEQVTNYNEGSGSSPKGLSSFGVGAYTHNLVSSQGSFLTSNQYSDLAINGQGFFMVQPPTTNGGVPGGTATPEYYTRNGAFQQLAGAKGEKYLTDASGNYLLGWQGTGTSGKISTGGTVSPIFIPAATTVTRNGVATQVDLPAQATTSYTVGANITPNNRENTTNNVETLSLAAYDSLSQSHNFTLQFNPTVATTSTVTTTDTDTSTVPPTVTTTGPTTSTTTTPLSPNVWNLTFASDESGAVITPFPSATPTTTNNASTNGSVTTEVDTTSTSNQGITVTFNGDGSIASPKTVLFQATWPNGQSSTITVDLTNLTQFGGTGKTVTNFTNQDGYLDGQIESLQFDQNGVLQGNYTNGKQVDLAQVGIARFAAPDSLNPISGTVFKQTVGSGAPVIDTANAQGSSIQGEMLEASTTDLGTEFTNMILAQKAYGMNSEVLKTADQMTQTVRDLHT